MDTEEARAFINTISDLTIANKAIAACLVAGKPVTVDNCAIAAGPRLNVGDPDFIARGAAFSRHVEDVIAAGKRLSPSALWN